MLKNVSVFLVFLFLHLAAWSSHAAEYQLFTATGGAESIPNAQYKEIVDGLKPGDRVKFSDGSTVELAEFMGRGNTTSVFAIKGDPNSVIRIPRISEKFKTLVIPRASITGYANANPPLLAMGADVPRVKGGLDLEFLIVERMPIDMKSGQDFTLNQFLLKQAEMPSELRTEVEDALLAFAKKTAVIASIGDIHSDQFVYSRSQKKWILLDWAGPIHPAFEISGDTLLLSDKVYQLSVVRRALLESGADRKTRWFKDFSNRIQKAVKRERIRVFEEDPIQARKLANVPVREWPGVVSKRNGAGLLTEGLCTKQFEWLASPSKLKN